MPNPPRNLLWFLPRRLQWRLSLPIAAFLSLTLLIYGAYTAREQSRLTEALIATQGEGLAKSIAVASVEGLLNRDIEAIEQLLLYEMLHGRALSLVVLDAKGTLVADVDRENGKPTAHFGRTTPTPPKPDQEKRFYAPMDDKVHGPWHFHSVRGDLIVWEAIGGGNAPPLGWVRVTLDMTPANQAQHKIWMSNLWLMVAMLLISLAGIYLFVRKPLTELNRASKFALALDNSRGIQSPGYRNIVEIDHLFQALNQASSNLARQERELVEGQRFLSLLTETLGEGVYATDKEGRCTFMNQEAERLLGWTRREMIGESICAWVHFHDENAQPSEQNCTRVKAIVSGAVSRSEDALFYRKDGSRLPVSVVANPLVENGEVKGAVVAFQDITLRKEGERAMRAAREAAENASQAKSDFLANMSHEIRTPMNAIIGMAHLALDTELTLRQQGYLKQIQDAGQNLLNIINDIIDFSRLDAGKLKLERVDFELGKLLDDVTNLYRSKRAGKDIELIVDVARDVPQNLVGPFKGLRQALLNYVSNAVKFTDRGEIDVSVRVKERDEGSALLHFSVRDTGIGLSDAQMAELFQSFQQADTSSTRKYGGTGLGLAISKRLAQLMGGEVGVESEPGQGSTFWFTARMEIGPARSRGLTPPSELNGLRALLVDDSDRARPALRDMLADLRLQVVTADSCDAALAELKRADAAGQPPAIAFIDWGMPGVDGIETGRRIRRLGLSRPPLLVLLAAYGREELEHQAKEAGFDGVFEKPMAPALFSNATLHLFNQKPEKNSPSSTSALSVKDCLPTIQGARILLVEDDRITQKVARHFIEAAGCGADVAENGAIAVDMLKTAAPDTYDLVFMDMEMPVMDGVVATMAIRALPGFDRLPIVALTANAIQKELDRCLDAGMNDFLAKPIDPANLWPAMLHWIKPRHALVMREAPAADTQAPHNVDPKQLAQVCKELSNALESSELKAIHLLEAQASLIKAAAPGSYRDMEASLQEMDFDQALAHLQAMMEKLGLDDPSTGANRE